EPSAWPAAVKRPSPAAGLLVARCDRSRGTLVPMARQRATRAEQIAQDERDLAPLGVAQQVYREMGGFSNFAISFTIISVLTGAVLLYGHGLKLAGPIINTVGWPVVSLLDRK